MAFPSFILLCYARSLKLKQIWKPIYTLKKKQQKKKKQLLTTKKEWSYYGILKEI